MNSELAYNGFCLVGEERQKVNDAVARLYGAEQKWREMPWKHNNYAIIIGFHGNAHRAVFVRLAVKTIPGTNSQHGILSSIWQLILNSMTLEYNPCICMCCAYVCVICLLSLLSMDIA